MKELGAFLQDVVSALRQHNIPFMVAGSLASTFYARPRTTQDADIVIQAGVPAVLALVRSLPSDRFYASEDAARDAVMHGTQFNVIDMKSAWKADLVLCKRRPFSVEEFQRRRPAKLLGVDVDVATPEDTILAKLEWARMGASSRQMEDARSIVEARGPALDWPYMERWAAQLGVEAELRAIR